MSVHKRTAMWIAPSHPTPIGPPLPLSPLDLSLLHSRIDLLYVYEPPATSNTDAITLQKLIRSLGDALSDYSCLAGRIVVAGDGNKAIHRSDDGVIFTAADADFTIKSFMPRAAARNEFSSFDTALISPALMTPLPSQPTDALLSIQVTRMQCGGWCIGVSVYHGIMDGESVFTFMQAWTARKPQRRNALQTVARTRRDHATRTAQE